MDKLWLPEGHVHDLHIEHRPLENAGTFTGGGWKLVWHTTESKYDAVEAMYSVLKGKRAAPHFVIGTEAGRKHPTVIQMVALNRAGRALGNDASDGFATNRANAIQVEICGFASESHLWSVARYEALANLTKLIRARVAIPNVAAQDFSKPRRMTDRAFVAASGYVGHSMAPDNDHSDPGRFREGLLVGLVEKIPEAGYGL